MYEATVGLYHIIIDFAAGEEQKMKQKYPDYYDDNKDNSDGTAPIFAHRSSVLYL